jgi:hypothetical protein
VKKTLRFLAVLPFVVLHFALCITTGLLIQFANRASRFVGNTIFFIGADEHRHGGSLAVGSMSTPMMHVFTFVNGIANVVSGKPWRTPITITMIYCETQGPGNHGANDHVKRDPGRECEEVGMHDEHGGRRLWRNNQLVACETCSAPVRRRLVAA